MPEQPKDQGQEPPTEGYCYLCARASREPVCRRCQVDLQDSQDAARELQDLAGRAFGLGYLTPRRRAYWPDTR